MTNQISSILNPFIKQLVQLKYKSKARKKSGLFLIEGEREITLALKGGYNIETILYYAELISLEQINALTNRQVDIFEVSKDVYETVRARGQDLVLTVAIHVPSCEAGPGGEKRRE